MNKARLAGCLAFLALSVAVDFSSKLLSIGSDLMLVGAAVVIIWPAIKNQSKQ